MFGGKGFLHSSCGNTQYSFWADHTADVASFDVRLTHMDTVGIDSQSDFYAVIDHIGNLVPGAQRL